MNNLNNQLEKTFSELEANVPGFISVVLIKSDDGTVLLGHSKSDSKAQLELMSPFHLQIYIQAMKSLDVKDSSDIVKEIIITTEKRVYVIASRSPKVIGVMTLDVTKANLALTRIYTEKIAQNVFVALRDSGVFND